MAPASISDLSMASPNIRAVEAIQEKHTDHLFSKTGVIGTAVGLNEEGNPAILVLLERVVPAGTIPAILEGAPVVMKVTGKITALVKPTKPGQSPSLAKRLVGGAGAAGRMPVPPSE